MTDHEPLTPREHEDLKAERRWPARALASPIWRIAGVGAIVVAGALAAFALVVWVVDDGDDTDPADLAPAEFLARIEDAASRDGQMLHGFIESTSYGDVTTSLEYWADAESDAIRLDAVVDINPTDPGDGLLTVGRRITAGDYAYVEEGPGEVKRFEATRCEGLSVWLSELLSCWVPGDGTASATVGDGDWEGRPARVLTLWYDLSADEDAGEPTPPPDVIPFYRLYVDRDNRLPLAAVWEAGVPGGTPPREVWQMTFSPEFIERTPENLALVDLRAFGYGTESAGPLSTLAASMPVYWLGEEYDAVESGESIVLYLVGPDQDYGPALSLRYKTPSGSDPLAVDIWRPDDWATSEAREPLHDSVCVSVSEEQLGGYTFTAYKMPQILHPLPRPGESAEVDCQLETRRLGGMGDSGLVLAFEAADVVVVIKATGTESFRNRERLRETIAATFQPYEPD